MTRQTPPHSPLQILLDAMRRRWEAGDEDGAVDIARLAAPYLHPRRAPRATTRAEQQPDRLTDAELHTALRQSGADESGAGMAVPADDPQ